MAGSLGNGWFGYRRQRWSVVSLDRSTKLQKLPFPKVLSLLLVNLVGVVHHPLTRLDAVLAVDNVKLAHLDVFPLCRFLIETHWHHVQRLPCAFVGHVQELVYKLLHDSILLGSNVESGWWLNKLGDVNLFFVIQLEKVRILVGCPKRFVDPVHFFVIRLLISCSEVWNACHLVRIAWFSNLGHLRRLHHWYLLELCFGLYILFWLQRFLC